MRVRRRFILVCLGLLTIWLSQWGATEAEGRAFDVFVERWIRSLDAPPVCPSDPGSLQELLNTTAPLPHRNCMRRQLNQRRIGALKKQPGLKLNAGFLYNTEPGAPDPDDIPYRWRFHVGPEWDLLQDGFFKHKGDRKVLAQSMRANAMREIAENRHEDTYYLRNLVISLFNGPKIDLLEKKRELLRHLDRIYQYQSARNEIFPEQLLEIQRELRRTGNMADNYRQYRREFSPGPVAIDANFPVVDIHINRLLHDLRTPPELTETLEANRMRTTHKHNPLHDVRLRLYLRYYHFNTPFESRRDYFSLGLMFNIPLPFSPRKPAGTLKAELDYLNSVLYRDLDERAFEALNDYYEYKYKLDDLIHFTFKHRAAVTKSKRFYIKYRSALPGIRPQDLLSALREILEIRLQILDIKQQLVLKLIDLFRHLGKRDIVTYLKPVDMEEPHETR